MAFNIQNASLRISAGFAKQFPTDAIPQVAFSGRSNVGKSSLINCLLGRKSLARISSAPGKTITVNFYEIDKKLFLVDLPGYGYAKRSPADKEKWSALTDGYFTENKNIDLLRLIVQLVDSRVGPTADDIMMLRFMNENNLPYVVVATKTDKLNKTERATKLTALQNDPDILCKHIIPFSTVDGEGKTELWKAIKEYSQIT